jgi:hypothetical protein
MPAVRNISIPAITGLDRPWGFQELEAPRFQDNRHMNVVGLSTLSAGRLYPKVIFLALVSVRGWVKSRSGRIMSKKNCNYTMGNRNRDLPACSAVPQQTAPPLASVYRAILLDVHKHSHLL